MDKLERKFGRFAIKRLMLYVVIANAAVFVADFALAINVFGMLDLRPWRVIHYMELWRVLTFIAVPPRLNILFMVIMTYFYYMIGTNLEHQWGSFRMNVYYLIGALSTIAVSFIGNAVATSTYINTSLFLAFAMLFPEHRLLIFFVIPVKVKWLGWLTGAGLAFMFVVTPTIIGKMLVVAPLINFFLFFGKRIARGAGANRRAHINRSKFQVKMSSVKAKTHKCTVCGITEADNSMMEFRYCSKCNGDYEYCMDHLRDHEHR